MIVSQQARSLRFDRRAYGDHDFTGAALRQWKRQRAAYKALLRRIEEHPNKKISRQTYSGLCELQCPCEVQPRGGTNKGFWWIVDVIAFISGRTDRTR